MRCMFNKMRYAFGQVRKPNNDPSLTLTLKLTLVLTLTLTNPNPNLKGLTKNRPHDRTADRTVGR